MKKNFFNFFIKSIKFNFKFIHINNNNRKIKLDKYSRVHFAQQIQTICGRLSECGLSSRSLALID